MLNFYFFEMLRATNFYPKDKMLKKAAPEKTLKQSTISCEWCYLFSFDILDFKRLVLSLFADMNMNMTVIAAPPQIIKRKHMSLIRGSLEKIHHTPA